MELDNYAPVNLCNAFLNILTQFSFKIMKMFDKKVVTTFKDFQANIIPRY